MKLGSGGTALVQAFAVTVALLPAVGATYVDPSVLDACPGYTARNVKVQRNGLTADLVLGGKACNVFGTDIPKLSLSVVYETGMSLQLST